MKRRFTNLTIAIPESRQLDVLSALFEKRGAEVMRCPLVAIHDNPDQQAVRQWLQQFIAHPPDYFIILTGEGIYRLTDLAEREGLRAQWQAALAGVYKLARGPKPNRALKCLDLQAQQLGEQPTTEGIIASLEKIDLRHKTLAVQLYGEDPNRRLQDYLAARACPYHCVAPYIYASDIETDAVVHLIKRLAQGYIDLICFTSKAQYQRLQNIAEKYALQTALVQGLTQTAIAAVGPVVAAQLTAAGYTVAVMPDAKFFMKPMVRAIEKQLINRP
ncbi:MAG: uroporphyrinogen-III synthase [Cellvibrionaceae bacterium]|nr:uroporphyrinogen-III synthase [Cellvibrionaceae bacterium]